MAQLGNKHPSAGGLCRTFSTRFDRDLKSRNIKNPDAIAADLHLTLSLESLELQPETKDLKRLQWSSQNASVQRSLIGLAHGPVLPHFENASGMNSLGALALQGKRALTLFQRTPSGRQGRAFISPLSFWIGSDPMGHSWIPDAALPDQKFVKYYTRSEVPHAKALTRSIQEGERISWSNNKWQRRNTNPEYYDIEIEKARKQ